MEAGNVGVVAEIPSVWKAMRKLPLVVPAPLGKPK
jgi:hypothetical protein